MVFMVFRHSGDVEAGHFLFEIIYNSLLIALKISALKLFIKRCLPL